MAAESACKKSHAIMISVPYQGHINPFVGLALKLASNGFSITFVHLEFIHHKLSKAHHKNPEEFDLFSEARESGLDIRYTTMSDGFPLEFDRDLHIMEYWESLLRDFPTIVEEFVGKIIRSDQVSVYFLVADTNYFWPATIAKKYNLVNVSLWTEPALVFSLIYHLDLLREKGHFPCKDNIEEEIDYVPGVGKISTRDLMPYLKEAESQSVLTRILSASFKEVKKADFILHNTVQELESETLSSLNKYQPNYAVGPINFSKSNLPTNTTVSKSLWSESDCTKWLDSKPMGSVLYVSFGSLVQTSKQVIEELAHGLLLSEVNFIWVVRLGIAGFGDDCGDNNVLPFEFEDEIKMKDKGLIIPWCDQIRVLSNTAIGGFLTHNGWNSTLESMWCGVPMICYPINWDQPTNRKLVVDDWKIGINLCDYGTSVDRKQVAEKIKQLMSGTTSMSLRKEADNIKAILQKAVEVDGSSEKNFDQFIENLRAKISNNEN
ncbi:hypothetical protein ABFS82_10G093500 [Erythranthe guttata]|uniref:Glycosyltransferase n=1 Tax=Erythranthe guttata TaxID=4155 RepID=A0A022R6K0_ERYGU|nr:PREDICTED: UDP-glycosyltransferase 86A1-like [Erythranthe guttata]XP_012840953.1 PREDICTED: UDP-glycosyltransferase 86A1-like [Erythranthe guttata]EYU34484.1 hypothetical protein MIMGU_mgv1a005271mg [Erythranthe guttata]EYU34485.1 hypothetical protein MIMGU_mgv1a017916mg [Erythranthe guttata]|eukprot:XP_012840952.1 PREDICTED: UDP-glycosyltransferase 86A1-like [Erythranthe guttata]